MDLKLVDCTRMKGVKIIINIIKHTFYFDFICSKSSVKYYIHAPEHVHEQILLNFSVNTFKFVNKFCTVSGRCVQFTFIYQSYIGIN